MSKETQTETTSEIASTITSSVTAEQKFLHDLASPLSILKLTAKRLLKTSEEKVSAGQQSDLESKLLGRMLAAVESLEVLHADHKMRQAEKKSA